MAETIRDYLVSLGFQVDKASEARFQAGLASAAKTAAGIAASLTAAASAISAAVIKISADFDSLYFAAQRSNASVASIKSLTFALSQVGGSSGQAQAAIEGVASAIRTNPGVEGLLNSLGIATRENGRLKDTATIIDGIVKTLSTKPYYVSAQIAGVLGIDEKTFQVLVTQWPKIKAFQEEYRKQAAAFGVDPDKAAESSNRLMTSFRELMLSVELVSQKIAVELQPTLTRYMEDLGTWFRDHSKDIERAILAIMKAVEALAVDLAALVKSLEPVTTAFGNMAKALGAEDGGLKWALEAVLTYMATVWVAGMLLQLAKIHPALAIIAAALGYGALMAPNAGIDTLTAGAPQDTVQSIYPSTGPDNGNRSWFGRQYDKLFGGSKPEKDSTPPGEGLAPIKSKNGQTAWVAKENQAQFQGFIDDLEASGYTIKDLGGFADRQNVNDPSKKSEHAHGRAIDINPGQNPNGSTQTDLPSNTGDLAKKWGLGWGMNWKSNKDPMHFSTAPREGGRIMTPEEVDALRKQGEDAKARMDDKRSSLFGEPGSRVALGGSISRSASISQSTKIEIHGSSDPAGTSAALGAIQPRLNADLLRNSASAFA